MGQIVTDDELVARVRADRQAGRTIAFANGCFDIIHAGHVRYLEGARAEADRLVVAINDDRSVEKLKGPGRPVLPVEARAELVAALRAADYVVPFGEENVERLLRLIRPDVHCKGTDYAIDTVPEREVMREIGGRIAIVGDPKHHNTRDLLARIRTGGTALAPRSIAGPVKWLAKRRVALGFLSAVFAYWLARPTVRSLAIGLAVAIPGELLRIWASGHLDKAREITRSGPYRYIGHPLYLGSFIMGIGFAIATNVMLPALIVLTYLGVTLSAAMTTEEAGLAHQFAATFADRRKSPAPERSFSFARVRANREYRAVAGFILGAALLAVRMRF